MKPEENFRLDLDDYIAWVRARGLKSMLIINPGNPTGQLFSLDSMFEFLRRANDMELIVVDESFIDFAAETVPSLLPVAKQFTNLLLVRSMSKHCGVPGLRLGYCYSENLYVLNACVDLFQPGMSILWPSISSQCWHRPMQPIMRVEYD